MNSYRLKTLSTTGLALVVMLTLLAGCTPPATPVPPQPPAEPTKPAAREGYGCGRVDPDYIPASAVAGAHYILNQVIITGPASGVKQVVDELNAQGAGLAPIQTCHLNHLLPEQPAARPWSESSHGRGEPEPVVFPPAARAELTTGLYSLPLERSLERSVERLVVEINKIGQEYLVFADPNYLTGPLEDANPASPCAVEDDPFEVGGSPFEVGGSSTGGQGADAAAGAFWKQWAFEQIDLQADGSGRGNWTGDGVTVAVFDTSPFASGARPAPLAEPINLTLAFPPMLNALPPAPVPTASTAVTVPITVADHGLFAAGLVYAVAPASTIHLVRVLNEYGCGDLWTLNNAINEFTAQRSKEGGLDNVVLNFSLGVHQPRDFAKAGWPAQIVSLNEALRNAQGRGAVLVAASGNDSYKSAGPRPMQLPADWGYVIGVAASNTTPEFACYSNKGDVLAPGGDGRLAAGDACQPRAQECQEDDAGCALGVISLATQSTTGYRFWVGTSFAAPLVSGQAALLLSSGLGSSQIPSCIQSTMVNPNRQGGQPVVNVAESVSRCVTP